MGGELVNIKYFLLIITILGFLARSRVLVIAGLLLLTIYEFEIDFVFEFLGNKGIEIGLIFFIDGYPVIPGFITCRRGSN